jgi:hypothetical protein
MKEPKGFVRRMLGKGLSSMRPKTWKGQALLYGIPALLLLALLDPVFGIVHKVFDLFARILTPLLETTIGRIVGLLVAMALGATLAAWLLRERVYAMRSRALLARHFEATAALVTGDRKKARDLLLAIGKRKRLAPTEYPWIAQDAYLKLARLALADGRASEAMGYVARVSDPDLPIELERSRAQLRIAALVQHGGALPQTLLAEAEAACERHPDDAQLFRELRRLRLAGDDLLGTAEAQVRVVQNAEAIALPREQETLCRDAAVALARALADDDVDVAKKLQRMTQKLPGPTALLLQGQILAHKGDFRGAVRAYGQTASPEGLDRIAELLRANPGALEPRELLAACPMQGIVLLIARELAHAGQTEPALRAARTAASMLAPTPTVCLVVAEALEQLGQAADSQRLAEQAVLRLLRSGRADEGPGQPSGRSPKLP